MSSQMDISHEIVLKLLENKITPDCLFSWLKDIKSSAGNHGLLEEVDDISQFNFINNFLNIIRNKASCIISERRPKISSMSAVSSSSPVTSSKTYVESRESDILKKENEQNINVDNNYLKEFPCLQENPSKKRHKLHKRIKPTTVRSENTDINEKPLFETNEVESCCIPSSLTTKTEELLSQRFFSKKDKSPKQRYSPLDVNISFKNKQNFVPLHCNNVKYKRTNKLIDLYNYLLTNSLVPNISNEIRFILNTFNVLTDSDFSFSVNSIDERSFLTSENEWRYFCINIISKQEYLISKLECNILKFLISRLSLFNIEIPSSYLKINKDTVFAMPGCSFYGRIFTINKLSVSNFYEPDDFIFFCEQRKKFLDIEKNWLIHRSEVLLKGEIINLLHSTPQTNFYFLGQFFVSDLVRNVEESIRNGLNSEQKIAQLNTRLTKPMQQNDPESDISFHPNEIFFKLWLDCCLTDSPTLVHFIKYWLIHTISALSKDSTKDVGDSFSSEIRSLMFSALKINITLARFLGYVEFYYNRQYCFKLTEIEKKRLIGIQSEVLPNYDLKSCLREAIKNGTLVLTIPWIVEYLCMADYISVCLPYYQDILLSLTSFYLSTRIRCGKEVQKGVSLKKDYLLKTTIMVPQRSFNDPIDSRVEGTSVILNQSSLIFIVLWIGRLFDNKVFGESLFFETALLYQEKLSQTKFKSGKLFWKNAVDCADFVKRDIFIFCCSHFSKMKYWENVGPSYIKNIRPITLDSENISESLVNIQDLLEEDFLSDHQSMNTIISFIVERISVICQNQIARIISPQKTEIQVLSNQAEISKKKGAEISSTISPEQIDSSFVIITLDHVKPKLLEVLKECEKRIQDSIRCLSPPDISLAVIKTFALIAYKKLKRQIKDWLLNEGYSIDEIEKCLLLNETKNDDSGRNYDILNKDHPAQCTMSLSTAFSDLHKLMREMSSQQPILHDFESMVIKFRNLCLQLQQFDGHRSLLKDLYIVSWDYVFLLVSNYDKVISPDFFREMILFWIENHHGDNEDRILCPRVIKAASLKHKDSQNIIAANLANLLLLCLEGVMITCEKLEAQSVAMLRFTYSKEELEFLKLCFTTLCDLVISTSLVSTPQFVSTVEFIIDSVDDILNLENCS